ncbi:hypothetical protein JOF29_000162 [Kribbella aluminosa]|uniref:Type VII secretion system protein EssD-like domain-containing protein n=1 Tax=Kribbella aluminosa TaxID=416017 RepID=A0ABS4UBP8_9ACTN|nr:DNA/RNA non-specific endonuclease [Kribbella aluminosa]MBP2349079.1 hypothetical protein [Kribbella aluminosa]
MHEKMLQSPVFTRLGWGSGNDADSDREGDVRSREPREQAVDPEGRQDGGEPELADGSEPATRNGDAATPDTEIHDGSSSPEEQAGGDSASGSEETAGAGPETPVVADAPNQADEMAATPEDRTLDSEARDDPKSTEPRSDSELADQRSVDEADTVATAGADEEQRHRLDAAVDTESTVQGGRDAALPDGESLTTLPDEKTVAEGPKESETSLLASDADASAGVQGGGGGNSDATIPSVRRLIEVPPPHSESAPAMPSDTPDHSHTAHDGDHPQKVAELPGGPIKLSTSNRADRRALNKPAADSTIVVDEKFTYHTDEHRRVMSASATLTVVDLDHPRNNYAQRTLAGKLPGDHAGHLFARIFQGPGHKVNLTPMEGMRVNKTEFDTMEREWRQAIQQGKEVEVFVELDYPDEGPRPEYISVVYKIDGKSYTRDIKNTPMKRKDDSSA